MNLNLFSTAKTEIGNLEQSGLVTEKISKIKELKPGYEDRLKEKKAKISKEYAYLRKELKKDNPELENLKRINKQLHKLKEEAKEIELEYQYELSKFISSKERKTLKKILKLETKKKKKKKKDL